MCGRYSFATNPDVLRKQFPDVDLPAELDKNYNLAPTQQGYVVLNESPGTLSRLKWGLIPSWSKDPKMGARMINARSETALDKPSFRTPIRKRRCLVLADSFYEWQREGKTKTPYRILRTDDSLLVMAGIWDVWKNKESDEWVQSYSVLTCAPNEEMDPIHNRMPLLFTTAEQWQAWLKPEEDRDYIEPLLTPTPDGVLQMYPVHRAVGNVRNNGPDLHERVDPAAAGG